MRITREILLKLAQDTVDRRVREDHGIVAAYLCGSLLGNNYILGGAADIDLVFIRLDSAPQEREILSLTEEVHLDIAHHLQRDYRQTRKLRLHPWLGPTLNVCTVLHDPQHFMDFTQASVRGQFDRADRVIERSRVQLERARQIWFGYQTGEAHPGPGDVITYLRAVGMAANAIASLNGSPLTERRFLFDFPARAAAVGRPGLYAGLLGLLGAADLEVDVLASWLPAWLGAYRAVPVEAAPPRLHIDRAMYYFNAFEALLASEQPKAALWPLLRTWTMAVDLLPFDSPHRIPWQTAVIELGLLDEAFRMRIDALDAYLDVVDETLEIWGRERGAWTP